MDNSNISSKVSTRLVLGQGWYCLRPYQPASLSLGPQPTHILLALCKFIPIQWLKSMCYPKKPFRTYLKPHLFSHFPPSKLHYPITLMLMVFKPPKTSRRTICMLQSHHAPFPKHAQMLLLLLLFLPSLWVMTKLCQAIPSLSMVTPEVNEPSNENIFPKFVCEMGAKLVA